MSTHVHFIEAGDVEAARKHGLTLLAMCGVKYVPHPRGVASDLPACTECEEINGRPVRAVAPEFPRPRPHFVYRHYDEAGRLLYVGCTGDPRTRQLAHQQNSWWFSQSVRVRLTVYPNRLHALRVERDTIVAERPIWNVRHQDYSAWDRPTLREVRDLAHAHAAPAPVLRRFHKLAGAA